jgi:hypothetical protein
MTVYCEINIYLTCTTGRNALQNEQSIKHNREEKYASPESDIELPKLCGLYIQYLYSSFTNEPING